MLYPLSQAHLGEVDIEEEGLLGVGDLDAVLPVPLRAGTARRRSVRDAKVVHGLGDHLHRRRTRGNVRAW